MCGCKTWSLNRIRIIKALKLREIRQMNTVPSALVLRPSCVPEKSVVNKKRRK
jgi:hypothetical protein